MGRDDDYIRLHNLQALELGEEMMFFTFSSAGGGGKLLGHYLVKNKRYGKHLSKIMKAKECIKCGDTRELTQDYIVPKWFLKCLPQLLGTNFSKWNRNRGQTVSNKQTMCSSCNGNKGSKLDFSHEKTRELVRDVILHLEKELRLFTTTETKKI